MHSPRAMEPSVASFNRSALWKRSACICLLCQSWLYSLATDTLPINSLARIYLCCLQEEPWLSHIGMDVCNTWQKWCLRGVKWKLLLRNIWNKLDEELIAPQSTIWTKVIQSLKRKRNEQDRALPNIPLKLREYRLSFTCAQEVCTNLNVQRSPFSVCLPVTPLGSS